MEQLVNFVIRPPRAQYTPHDLLDEQFTLRGRRYKREDIKLKNERGQLLECSHYMPYQMPEDVALPCVIYCHGNSGCRADANEAAIILLPSNITVFTLDFSGSGQSEGEYVTLGSKEMEDVKVVTSHLREDKRISYIGLWGRSMGAVTSLLYGSQDPSIAGMVLDSPFSNLVDLMMELVDVYKIPFPKFTLKVAIQYMRKVIQKKAQFDINELDSIQFAKKSFIPVLFGHATGDLFIPPHHSESIFKHYMGDKNIIKFEGDHNSPRPQFYYDSITIFFYNVLQPPDIPVAAVDPTRLQHDLDDLTIDNGIDEHLLYEILGGQMYSQLESSNDTAPVEPSADVHGNTTEEAIMQSRNRWRMTRMEVPSDLGNSPDESDSFLRTELRDNSEAGSSFSQGGRPPLMRGAEEEKWDAEEREDLYNRFAYIPSTEDEEERMLMEAIAASLQDSKVSPVVNTDSDENPSTASATSTTTNTNTNTNANTNTNTNTNMNTNTNTSTNSSSTSSSQSGPTVGMFEALGQRWGIGLFRSMGSRRSAD